MGWRSILQAYGLELGQMDAQRTFHPGHAVVHRVAPYAFSGSSGTILGVFGMGPKFTIICGACMETFTQRIMVMDRPPAKCPRCEVVNILPLETVK